LTAPSCFGCRAPWCRRLSMRRPHCRRGLLSWHYQPRLACCVGPAGEVPFAKAGKIPWDAAWWWMRPDGVMQIQVASRLTKRQDLLAPFGVRSPLWSGTTLLVNPAIPRTEEVQGSPEASEFVSILGATWLLMEQRTVAETRVLSDPTSTGRSGSATGKPAAVSIIELRRPEPQSREPGSGGSSGRTYRYRWTVEGHWRQQPCGPNRSQRKPTYITDYEKGPKAAPFKDDRVKIFRR
jgi:hypothetical protein